MAFCSNNDQSGLLTVLVAADPTAALKAASAGYDRDTVYVEASLERCKEACALALKTSKSASDTEFLAQLVALKAALDALELLTPLLPDEAVTT